MTEIDPAMDDNRGPAGDAGAAEASEPFHSGFVTLFGRPNTGKSTLLNRMLGRKVTITSDKAQTTRHQIRGVHTTDTRQIVFVDTPGVGKPRTALGEKLNATAADARSGVDVVCFVVDGRSGYGRGDQFLAERLHPPSTVVVLNKIDGMRSEAIGAQLTKLAELDASAYFPVSAQTGDGIDALLEHLSGRMPEGPHWYPEDQFTDMGETMWVAELVREQLLRVLRAEVPHSVATRVTEWQWPKVRVEILVERESQKGIVIGHKGEVLKQVGTLARKQLPKGVFLDLFVTVDKNWQQDVSSVERLGY